MSRGVQLLLALALVVLAAVLLLAVHEPVSPDSDLVARVAEHLPQSGVEHDVTAVLLNFRAYDTLLEMAVLFLALAGVRGLGGLPHPPGTGAPGQVLQELARALLPLLVLVAGYVLWVGAYGPGGAFQASALLAGAGVLALLAGLSGWAYALRRRARVLVSAGLLVFIAVAAGTGFRSGQVLALPPARAGSLILLVEVVATVSLAATLVLLFMGASDEEGGDA